MDVFSFYKSIKSFPQNKFMIYIYILTTYNLNELFIADIYEDYVDTNPSYRYYNGKMNLIHTKYIGKSIFTYKNGKIFNLLNNTDDYEIINNNSFYIKNAITNMISFKQCYNLYKSNDFKRKLHN